MFGRPLEGIPICVFCVGLMTLMIPRLVYVAKHACDRRAACCARVSKPSRALVLTTFCLCTCVAAKARTRDECCECAAGWPSVWRLTGSSPSAFHNDRHDIDVRFRSLPSLGGTSCPSAHWCSSFNKVLPCATIFKDSRVVCDVQPVVQARLGRRHPYFARCPHGQGARPGQRADELETVQTGQRHRSNSRRVRAAQRATRCLRCAFHPFCRECNSSGHCSRART